MSFSKYVKTIALAALTASCASHGPRRPATPTSPTPEVELAPRSVPTIRVQISDGGSHRVVTLDMDDYVVGCVQAEIGVYGMPADAAARVLEMQALLCRTNAVANRGRHERDGFDLCSGSHCQIYRTPPPDRFATLARQAVRATEGRILVHGGRPIQAIFHADCAGYTSAAETVWGGSEPYLRARADEFCRLAHKPTWVFAMPANRLRDALNRNAATRVGHSLRSVRIVERDQAGRASRIELTGDEKVVVRGSAFRWALLQAFGARSLKSTRFDVDHRGDVFEFHGEGNGHGVGLCQTGALARARAGHKAEEILRFYYPGVEIS